MGGVIGVSSTTLFVARAGFWTGRPTKLLGSWPREEISMTPVMTMSDRLRRFDLRFPGSEVPSHLELAQNGRKDDTLWALFRSSRTS
jgi:hypothetical protein